MGGQGNTTGTGASLGDGGPPSSGTCAALATLPVRVPTYFVDFGAGSDTNDGKSQGSAWKHAPGDASAGGSPRRR